MRVFRHIMILGALLLTLGSCSDEKKDSKPVPDYVPVQTAENGKWGMLGPDGKLLFANKFDSEPSLAIEGRFSVAEGESYALYTAEPSPKKLNKKPLASVGSFVDGIAPVSYKGSRITIINADGSDRATLMPVDGKELLKSDVAFRDGLLMVCTSDGKFGYVDRDGQPAIKPQYDSALPFAFGYAMVAKVTDPANPQTSLRTQIIDSKGKPVLTVAQQYQVVDLDFRFKRLIVKDINGRFGFLSFDDKFEEAPSSVVNVGEAFKQGYIYINDKGVTGVMGMDGKPIIEPKYDYLACGAPDTFIFQKGEQWGLLSLDGKQTADFGAAANVGYMEGFGYFAFGKTSGVRMLDDAGKSKCSVNIFSAGFNSSACSSVRSDWQSEKRLASELAAIIAPAGIGQTAWGTPAERTAPAPDAGTGCFAALPSASPAGVDFLINCIGVFTAPVGEQSYNEQTGAGFNFNPASALCGADFYLRTEAPLTDANIKAIIKALEANGYRLTSSQANYFEMQSAASSLFFCRLKGGHDANFYIGATSDAANCSRWQKILSAAAVSGELPTTEQLFGLGDSPSADAADQEQDEGEPLYVDRSKPRQSVDAGETVSSAR